MNLDLRQVFAALLSGMILLVIGALGGWVLTVSDRVARVEQRQLGDDRRIASLEGGLSTPLSGAAVARFETVNVSISALSQRIGSLESLVGELNRRLRDGRAEGKVEPKSKGG